MDIFNSFVEFFQKGGAFMYPIAIVFGLGVAIAIERWIYLTTSRARNLLAWRKFQPLLKQADLKQVMNAAGSSKTGIGKIISYGLARANATRRSSDVEMAMEEGLMEILPRLEKRTHYLATFANIATLLGLLGTIMGLIGAFNAVANANPAEKADLLSAKISIAMNTTAFGLMAGIPLLLIYTLLQTKTTEVVDSLEMASVRILNIITQRSQIKG